VVVRAEFEQLKVKAWLMSGIQIELTDYCHAYSAAARMRSSLPRSCCCSLQGRARRMLDAALSWRAKLLFAQRKQRPQAPIAAIHCV
jgi:hypothetical protein